MLRTNGDGVGTLRSALALARSACATFCAKAGQHQAPNTPGSARPGLSVRCLAVIGDKRLVLVDGLQWPVLRRMRPRLMTSARSEEDSPSLILCVASAVLRPPPCKAWCG